MIKVLNPKTSNIFEISQKTLQIQCKTISLLMPRQEGQNSGTAFKHFIEDDRQRFTTKTCRRKEEQFFPAGNGSVML
jgi:predicted nucleic-acid-binding Zn-ribbon protein